MKRWIRNFIIGVILSEIAVGGTCGCCGKWVDNCLVDRRWRITLCSVCKRGGQDSGKI